MIFDSYTILVGGCALLVLLGGIFVASWLRHREHSWLLWLGVPLVAAALGSLGFMQQGRTDDLIAVVVGNGLRIFAIACYWQGARVFEGRRPILWPVLGAVAFWVALGLIPDFVHADALRVAVTSVLSAGFIGMAAVELFRGRSERLASRWAAIAVFVSFTLFMLVRAAVSPVAPFPMGAGATDPFWFGVLMLVIISHALLAGLLMLAMAMERMLLRQQANAMSDAVTGLLSRRAFIDFAARTNRRREGVRSSLALIVLDIAGLRHLNASGGRSFGDDVLRHISSRIEATARPGDNVFRISTDRICVAMAEASRQQAIALAEAIRDAVVATGTELGIADLSIGASIGIAETLHPVDVRVMLSAAEGAAAQAAQLGPNRIVVAEAATLFRAQIDDIAGPRRGAG